jgi:hypothetical protein
MNSESYAIAEPFGKFDETKDFMALICNLNKRHHDPRVMNVLKGHISETYILYTKSPFTYEMLKC